MIRVLHVGLNQKLFFERSCDLNVSFISILGFDIDYVLQEMSLYGVRVKVLDAYAYVDHHFASSLLGDTFILCTDYNTSIQVLQKVAHKRTPSA